MLAASAEARDLPAWFVCARFRDVPLGARAVTNCGSTRARTFSIGADAQVDAPVPLARGGRHALVTAVPGGCEVRPIAGMRVEVGGQVVEVMEGAAVLVPRGAHALVRRDEVVVSVEPLERVPVVGSGTRRSSPAALARQALAIVPFALVALVLTFLPPDARTLGLSLDDEIATRRLPVIFVPKIESGPSVLPVATGGSAQPLVTAAPKGAALPAARTPKRPGAGRSTDVGTASRAGSAAATSVGILGVLIAPKTAALQRIFERDAGGLAIAALAGLEGGGEGGGWDGPLGPSGSGAGEAGEGTGTIGDRQMGSTCAGGRPCLGGRLDGPSARLGPRTRIALPEVTGALESVRGRLERDAVRRVVRLHLNEVRACYDRALLRAPSLNGRLVVGFVVGPDGVVRSAIAEPDSTIGDAGLRTCVAEAVRRWSFPAVPDGGVTVVSYPFVFAPAGG